jgi:hypothetical protein
MLEYENDLLVVDELLFDPRYPTNAIIRIDNNYFMVRDQAPKPLQESDIRPFKSKPAEKSYKVSYDNEFYFRHMMPRVGFKVPIGRAITQDEFDAVAQEYHLGDEDISKEFDDKKGALYGKYAKEYKSVQVKVPPLEAIPLEQKLRDKGIEASNGSPGRVNIRTEWGGRREGAGRPATGRRKRTFYIDDDEYQKLTAYLETLRQA